MAFEFQILDFLQTLHSPFLNHVMYLFTRLGDNGTLWIITMLILLSMKKTRKVGFVMMVALIIEYTLTDIVLKPLVGRIRPYDIKEPLEMILKRYHDFSFPSGHTGASFAAVTVFFLADRERRYLWKIAFVIGTLIAFSRIYFYVHFPTDVLGGICVGIIDGFVGYYMIQAIEKRRKKASSQ